MYRDNFTSDTDDYFLFISDYASWMLGCGATCIRIEKNIQRIAQIWGLKADLTIMPSHINMSLTDMKTSNTVVMVSKAAHCGINFGVNIGLSQLSWAIADSKLTFDETRKRFLDVISAPTINQWLVLVLVGVANASFCRLFGGDQVAMILVLMATIAGYRLKQIMLSGGCDVRLTFLCSAFFSSVISAGGHVFGWGSTPEIALGTGVLYLIPGVPYLNAVSDMMERHYLCAFSRFADACVLTACISIGLCAGMFMLGLNWF